MELLRQQENNRPELFTCDMLAHLLPSARNMSPMALPFILNTPFSYSTLADLVPPLEPLARLYRKVFVSKRQPTHTRATIDKLVRGSPDIAIHLLEVMVLFRLGDFALRPLSVRLSLETHRSLVSMWAFRRSHLSATVEHVLEFYCQEATCKAGICALAEYFAFIHRPFESTWQTMCPQWTGTYIPALDQMCNTLRADLSSGTINKFNSSMAKLGPQCVIPTSFWETVMHHVQPERVSDDLVRQMRQVTEYITYPSPLNVHERHLLKLMSVPPVYTREILAATRFWLMLDRDGSSYVIHLIYLFFIHRMGPSVFKSKLTRLCPEAVRGEIRRAAWLWRAVFGAYSVAVPWRIERASERAVMSRIESLGISVTSPLYRYTSMRGFQFCPNCGRYHTIHNAPVTPNPRMDTIDDHLVVVHDAADTIGVTSSGMDLLNMYSMCSRTGSRLAENCRTTESFVIHLRGLVYHYDYKTLFICCQCGIPAVWDEFTLSYLKCSRCCSL